MNSHKFRQRTSCVRKILSLYFVSSRETHRLLPLLRSVFFVVPKSKLLPQQRGICCCDATDPRHEPSALFGHSFAAVTRTAERQDTIFLFVLEESGAKRGCYEFPSLPGLSRIDPDGAWTTCKRKHSNKLPVRQSLPGKSRNRTTSKTHNRERLAQRARLPSG